MQVSDRIFHISHNDLDGYASQFAVSRVFYNVAFFNGNYNEIELIVSQVLKQIKMEILAGKPPKVLLLTDINISLDMADKLQAKVSQLPVPVKLQLLDHHATGQNCADKYDWYHLDTGCCATRLTYQWLKPWLTEELDSYLDELSALVNVTDLWLTDDPRFDLANLMADMIFNKPLLINEMDEVQRNYLFYHIYRIFEEVQKGMKLEQIERQFYDFRLDFLAREGVDSEIVQNADLCLENKFHFLILKYLKQNRPPTIEIDGYKVAIFFCWLGTTFQHVSSKYLDQNTDIDIAMRVGMNARLSLRTHKQHVNVGDLARHYFRGGGHPQAAGGVLKVREVRTLQVALKQLAKITGNSENT